MTSAGLPRRAAQAFRVLNLEQKAAAVGALLLMVSTIGPFSFVELAEVLLAGGVLALLFARAERREFHLPFGDGTVIAAAGVWAGALILARLFDRPLGQNLLALACAAILFVAGARERAKHPADDLAPARDPDSAARGRGVRDSGAAAQGRRAADPDSVAQGRGVRDPDSAARGRGVRDSGAAAQGRRAADPDSVAQGRGVRDPDSVAQGRGVRSSEGEGAESPTVAGDTEPLPRHTGPRPGQAAGAGQTDPHAPETEPLPPPDTEPLPPPDTEPLPPPETEPLPPPDTEPLPPPETEPLPPPEFEPYRPEPGEQLHLAPEGNEDEDQPPRLGPASPAGRRRRNRRR